MKKYNYIIGSGWWCGKNEGNERRVIAGDDKIRSKEFHRIWYQSVNTFTSPQKIIITDSNSPVKPELNTNDERIEFLSLPLNAGHSTQHAGKYSGWFRSVLMGLEYAILSDTDYFVYVEQDLVLQGENIIEHAISTMKSPFMFGNPEGTKQPLQQSFFIIRRDGMEALLTRMQRIRTKDAHFSPEMKFAYASTFFWRLFPEFFFGLRGTWRLVKMVKGFQYLPFGYGRTRPLNFNDRFFYFQHGSTDELKQYMMLNHFEY